MRRRTIRERNIQPLSKDTYGSRTTRGGSKGNQKAVNYSILGVRVPEDPAIYGEISVQADVDYKRKFRRLLLPFYVLRGTLTLGMDASYEARVNQADMFPPEKKKGQELAPEARQYFLELVLAQIAGDIVPKFEGKRVSKWIRPGRERFRPHYSPDICEKLVIPKAQGYLHQGSLDFDVDEAKATTPHPSFTRQNGYLIYLPAE